MTTTFSRRCFLATTSAIGMSSLVGRRVNADSTGADTDGTPVHETTYTEAKTFDWRFGMSLRTPVTFTNGLGTFSIPMDWPEQTIQVTSRDVSSAVTHLQFRDLNNSVRQVVMGMPRVTANSSVEVMLGVRVEKRDIIAPSDPSSLMIPKRISREMRNYMGNSPNIDASHGRIRALSRELESQSPGSAWQTVRLIYDTVRERVRYVEGDIRRASDALNDGEGDCEDMTSLFVALCRNAGVPARMVWIPGHCYPEFYLESSTGGETTGHWFPCQAAGSELFGEMQEDRPILQKGDRFKVPEERKVARYVTEFFRCDRRGNGSPSIRFVREPVL